MQKYPCGASGSHGSVNGALPPLKSRNFALSDAVKRLLSAFESAGLVNAQRSLWWLTISAGPVIDSRSIWLRSSDGFARSPVSEDMRTSPSAGGVTETRSEAHTSELQSQAY